MTNQTAPSGERPRRPGEGDRCPACGSTGGLAEDDDGYSCLMCGAPRVLVDGNVQRRGSEKPLLEKAKALKFRRAAFGIIAALTLVLGVVSLALAALFFGALGIKGPLFGFAAAVPLATSLASWLAVRHSASAIRATMTAAEVTVAKELVAASAARDATELGRLMRLPSGRAEELFGLAEVERLLDQPEVPGPERLRVEADEPPVAQAETELRNRVR